MMLGVNTILVIAVLICSLAKASACDGYHISKAWILPMYDLFSGTNRLYFVPWTSKNPNNVEDGLCPFASYTAECTFKCVGIP